MALKFGVELLLGLFGNIQPRKRADQHSNIRFEGHPCCVPAGSGGKVNQRQNLGLTHFNLVWSGSVLVEVVGKRCWCRRTNRTDAPCPTLNILLQENPRNV